MHTARPFITLLVATSLGCAFAPRLLGSSFKGQVPAALQTIESLAEDSYDLALAANNQQVTLNASKLDRAWRGFRAQALADGASAADLDALDRAVIGLKHEASHPTNVVLTARAANAVSGLMDHLFAVYSPVLPPIVNRLDYLGREIVLDAMGSDFDAAAGHLSATETDWNELKPAVLAAGGSAQADAFENSLPDIANGIQARASDRVVKAANATLELVDSVEKVFDPNAFENSP